MTMSSETGKIKPELMFDSTLPDEFPAGLKTTGI
jgi:hypothetical protein